MCHPCTSMERVTENKKKNEEKKEGAMYILPPQQSIAVLPITNMNDDASHDALCDGMTEDITTRLARIPELFVIARSTTSQYKGQAVNIKRLGQELGVRYVLTGSVRQVGQTLRMSVQLIDAITGAHVWAEMFDRVVKGRNVLKIKNKTRYWVRFIETVVGIDPL